MFFAEILYSLCDSTAIISKFFPGFGEGGAAKIAKIGLINPTVKNLT